MNRSELIERAKAILAEAYEEAAHMIALYLNDRPSEKLMTLCRAVDPDNPVRLESRVRRARATLARESGASSSPPVPTKWEKDRNRAAKQVARTDPDAIIADPDAERSLRAAMARKARDEAIASGGIDASKTSGQDAPVPADYPLNAIELATIVTLLGRFVEKLASLDPVVVHARDKDAILKATTAIEAECANIRAYFAGELIDPDQALREWSAS
jgi:hypothetical protein